MGTEESEGQSGGGAPGAFVDYKAQLYAWLEKHKEYPRRARLRRQEGTALLEFAMDRGGRVLSYRIVESSGYKLLDDEVVAMIERASPLPTPPAAMEGERRSEEHTSELQSLMRSSYAVFCLKKKKKHNCARPSTLANTQTDNIWSATQ